MRQTSTSSKISQKSVHDIQKRPANVPWLIGGRVQAEFVEGARGCVHIQFPNTLCKHNMHCWSVCCIIPVRISNVCVCVHAYC